MRQASGERLMDVLAASKRRCTLVDRGDMLSRHLTGDISTAQELCGRFWAGLRMVHDMCRQSGDGGTAWCLAQQVFKF